MPKSLTTEEFIDRAGKVHNDTYDYSNVKYTKSRNNVIIICKIHGEFEQIPNSHLRGHGCGKCGLNKRNKSIRKTTEQYINEVNHIHNNKYDYSNVEYKTGLNNITIICKTHGKFIIQARQHKEGKGCPPCEGYVTPISIEKSKDTSLKPIPAFKGYQITRSGNIFSEKSNKFLKVNVDRFKKVGSRRVSVSLYQDGKRKTMLLHRLIALTYLENPDNKPEVNHKDGNYYNNDCNNLEWVTGIENMNHCKFTGLIKNNQRGRIVCQYDMNGNFIQEFTSIKKAGEHIQIFSGTIFKALKGFLKHAGGFIWKYKKDSVIDDEEWREVIIDEKKTGYFVSNHGRVKSYGKIITGTIRPHGYRVIDTRSITGKQYFTHRLVALMFIPNPDNKPYVDHIDCDGKNNKVSNLRWTTHKENMNNENTLKKYCKPVQQLDNKKQVINTFQSIKEAIQYIRDNYGKKKVHIYKAVVDTWRKAGGFYWRLKE